jgi:hypothetical protein
MHWVVVVGADPHRPRGSKAASVIKSDLRNMRFGLIFDSGSPDYAELGCWRGGAGDLGNNQHNILPPKGKETTEQPIKDLCE